MIDYNEVVKIIFTTPDKAPKEYTVTEYNKIAPAEKVMMTVSENKFEYFNCNGEPVRAAKALVYLAKKRREYLTSIGKKY